MVGEGMGVGVFEGVGLTNDNVSIGYMSAKLYNGIYLLL
jgi:hypothetical protein